GSFVDQWFGRNWREIPASGMHRGAYHLARPGSADAQARHFMDVVLPAGIRAGDMLVLDLEASEQTGDLHPFGRTWAQRVRSLAPSGVKVLLYTYPFYWRSSRLRSSLPAGYDALWMADYDSNDGAPHSPPDFSPWRFWQYTSRGFVPGEGRNDVNLYRGSE